MRLHKHLVGSPWDVLSHEILVVDDREVFEAKWVQRDGELHLWDLQTKWLVPLEEIR